MSEKLQHKKTEHFRYSGSICGNVKVIDEIQLQHTNTNEIYRAPKNANHYRILQGDTD